MFKYISDGTVLQEGVSFVDRNGIKRSANWLAFAKPWQLDEAGIKKYDDPAPLDYRFATGYDPDGNVIWRSFTDVQPAFEHETRTKANALLAPTDWMVIREVDNGTALDPALKSWRESVRISCGQKLDQIALLTTTEQLAAYAASNEYNIWPRLD